MMKRWLGGFLLGLSLAGGVVVAQTSSTTSAGNPIATLVSRVTGLLSGNFNPAGADVTVAPASSSTAVADAVLCQVTSKGAGSVVSPGHTIGCFGYNHVQKNQDLAIGTEGKLIVDATGVTLASGTSLHAGLADVVSGSTITNMTLVNSTVTANHGTINTLKAFDFGITSSALIGNVFAYNAQDLTTGVAGNYGGFRCQITAATGHYCGYADGNAPWYLAGHVLAGNATAPTISSGCGTSPSITGRDEALTITVGSGGAATSCTIAFGTSYTTNAPVCLPVSNTDTGLLITTATNGFTVSKGTALTAGSKIMVACRGWL